MKTIPTVFAILLACSLFAQQPAPNATSVKGAQPINEQPATNNAHPEASSRQAYAVVVGISDYQDEDIPDLRFAPWSDSSQTKTK